MLTLSFQLKLDMSNGLNNTVSIDEFNQYKLQEDNKSEIQRLISRNTSDSGNQMMSPSHMLNLPQNTQVDVTLKLLNQFFKMFLYLCCSSV